MRTLRPGTRFTLTQRPLQIGDADPDYVLLRVLNVGVNNLPLPAKQGLAELFGPIPELLDESVTQRPQGFASVIAQATESGYANHFEAIGAATPWRPVVGELGLRHHPKPTAHGSQSAIVVGADGGASGSGADGSHYEFDALMSLALNTGRLTHFERPLGNLNKGNCSGCANGFWDITNQVDKSFDCS